MTTIPFLNVERAMFVVSRCVVMTFFLPIFYVEHFM